MIAVILTALVALIHIWIFVLEVFLWDKPQGIRAFGLQPDFAKATKILAANQGVYNGFLAAGLIWGIWLGPQGDAIKVFFLLCVAVAGVFGALTSSRKIIFVQTLPAALALIAVLAS
ncbi:hypothetical protein BVG79_00069 [Ketogulonicigenium robustum]|uniref:DUF1304 domain-containing protein n=1 Tax=Ketogulonicigenium robustum TaxID=92947 RepID=A0A1W6NW39_9RHOB|nr:DUF1304 domain-containing protein [Ketogulonicigenium robustum]ARO13429.1 hypothetical protein BVG79_00069 [Ketogulonicigenium robustum]